jgi:hypothetical protein
MGKYNFRCFGRSTSTSKENKTRVDIVKPKTMCLSIKDKRVPDYIDNWPDVAMSICATLGKNKMVYIAKKDRDVLCGMDIFAPIDKTLRWEKCCYFSCGRRNGIQMYVGVVVINFVASYKNYIFDEITSKKSLTNSWIVVGNRFW